MKGQYDLASIELESKGEDVFDFTELFGRQLLLECERVCRRLPTLAGSSLSLEQLVLAPDCLQLLLQGFILQSLLLNGYLEVLVTGVAAACFPSRRAAAIHAHHICLRALELPVLDQLLYCLESLFASIAAALECGPTVVPVRLPLLISELLSALVAPEL